MCTNHGTSQSFDQFLESLGELKRFIDTVVYDKVVIVGDFNNDLRQHSVFTYNSSWMILNYLHLTPDLVTVLILHMKGACTPDHILSINYCIDDISSVKCVHSPNNFSDQLCIKSGPTANE